VGDPELEGMTVVVSPLIALLKDQADSLGECGQVAPKDSWRSLG
jgi:superfamily II DNA helicase RecQ